MAIIWEKAIWILMRTLNFGHSYLITAVFVNFSDQNMGSEEDMEAEFFKISWRILKPSGFSGLKNSSRIKIKKKPLESLKLK